MAALSVTHDYVTLEAIHLSFTYAITDFINHANCIYLTRSLHLPSTIKPTSFGRM
jgi:hypothetical protein